MTDFDGAVDAMSADVPTQPERAFDVAVDQVTRQQRQALRASLLSARDANPAEMAKALRLADLSSLPVEVVERNLPEVEVRTKLDYWDSVLASAPATRGWLTNPVNAQIAGHDIAALAEGENIWRTLGDAGRAFVGGLVGDFAGSTLSGAGELYKLTGRALERPVRAATDAIGITTPGAHIPELLPWYLDPGEILRRPGEQIKELGKTIKPPEERQNVATDIAGGVGQLVGQITTAILSGGVSSLVTRLSLISSGADQFADRAHKAGKYGTVEGDVATVLGSSVTALTERMGLDLLLNRTTPQIRNAIVRRLIDVAAAGGIEATQEVIEGILHNVIEQALLDPDAEIFRGLEREATAAGGAGAIARAVLMAIARGRQRPRGQVTADDATAQLQAFNALGDRVAAMEMTSLSPQKTEEAVRAIVGQDGPRHVFVPAAKVQEYFQPLPPDEAEKQARAWGVDSQLAAAPIPGADVAIPTATYFAKVHPVAGKTLGEDIRLEQDGFSPREAKAVDKTARRLASRADDRPSGTPADSAKAVDPVDRIYDDVRRQARRAGVADDEARMIATFHAASAEVRAARLHVDPWELYRQSGLVIRRDSSATARETARRPGAGRKKPARAPESGSATEESQLARGKITFSDDQAVITLFRNSNASTLLHESGHLWLEQLRRDVARPDAPRAIKDDWAITAKWLGVGADGKITVEMHERWARAIEAYVMEGKAPSAKLVGVFAKFKEWLVEIYHKATELGVEPTPEIRGVFDRLLATPDQIERRRKRIPPKRTVAKPVTRGEAGRYADLRARYVAEDGLEPHHFPQAAARFISKSDSVALMMTVAEHKQTRSFGSRGRVLARMERDTPFRIVLSRDIRDIKGITGSRYNQGLLDALSRYRKKFPEFMKKDKTPVGKTDAGRD